MTDFSTIKNLYGITESCGCPAEHIHLGIDEMGSLPKVLIDYYSELGAHEGLNHAQDYLVAPQRLQGWVEEDFLVFWCENQDICLWGIRREDLELPNPPVYVNCDASGWEKSVDRLSDFFVAVAHFQALFALQYRSEEYATISKAEKEFVIKNFKQKETAFPVWLGIEFYGNHEDTVIGIIQNEEHYSLLYAASGKSHFDEMSAVLMNLGKDKNR